MKMKKFLLVGLLGVVTLCGLSSCDDDDDGGYVPFSYAVGDMVVKDGSEPYIQLDSKQTLFPSNGSRLPNYLLKDGKRVIVNFSFLEGQREGYDYYILINDIDSVLVKNVIPITPETTDSIGNDPVNVLDMWTTFSQAVLGDDVEVPTVDGRIVQHIPEGTQSGTKFRLRGQGIQYLNGRGRGDQYVIVDVEIPKKVTRAQREALKAFEDSMKEDNYEKRKGFFKNLRDRFS